MNHRHKLAAAIAVLMACMLTSACTKWRTTSLQPERFSADTSPDNVRLTLTDGTRLTARDPVMTGDSLVWSDRSRRAPGDSARRAVLTSDVRKVEVHGFDTLGTAVLFVLAIGLAVGVAVISSILHGID